MDLVDVVAPAAARAGLFTDFDGVIAEIVPVAAEARPRPGTVDALVALAGRLGRVTVVTGRPVAFVDPFVPAAIDVVGLYGLEARRAGEIVTDPEAESWRAVVADVVAAARAELGDDAVEDKGLSVTLHYRRSADHERAVSAFATGRGADAGLEARAARKSVELHPPVRRDKGTAIVDLADGLDPIAYLGDDRGDLPAFDGLDRLGGQGRTTVRVAVTSDEAPPELVARADQVVEGPAGAAELFTRLLARLG